MRAIYEPRGAAAEYAELACNLYRGCGHGCRYCYAPACLRMTAAEFARPAPRRGIIEALLFDAATMAGDERDVLLCFTCDPYQPLDATEELTRQAMSILAANNLRPRVLTKNPMAAIRRDADLLAEAGAVLGTTLAWTAADDCRRWEPHAPPPAERAEAIRLARDCGLRTWLSVEPVIDADQAIEVIRTLGREVDEVKVGKLNHNRAVEERTDWTTFCRRAVATLAKGPAAWYIKNDLWRHADAVTRRWGRAGNGSDTTETQRRGNGTGLSIGH